MLPRNGLIANQEGVTHDLSFTTYRSGALVPPHSASAAAIYLGAREHNRLAGITGYLHREDDLFCQYLEGPERAVANLMDRIRRDSRHAGVAVGLEGLRETRLFGSWDMAFSDADLVSFAAWRNRMAKPLRLADAGPADIMAFFEAMAQRLKIAV